MERVQFLGGFEMKPLVIVVLWAAFCAFVVVLSAGSMSAQVIEADACVEACHQQKSACVQACGQHANPMQCDSECRELLEDCLDTCPS